MGTIERESWEGARHGRERRRGQMITGKQKTGEEEEEGGKRTWKEQSMAGRTTLESLQYRIILSCF